MSDTNCPKCKEFGEENIVVVSTHLKWGKINKWQHFYQCVACNYESKVK